MTDHYPKVRHVEPLLNRQLFVTFQDGTDQVYDCLPLLQQASFVALEDDALFRRVKIDDGGYGISWNDAIDLSEAELWLRGRQPTENEIIRGGIHAQNH